MADAQKRGGDTGDISALRDGIKTIYEGLFDNWKAGIWHGVGSAYSNAMDQFLSSGQLIYAYKTLMYHTAVTPRMRRNYMAQYTPTVPDAQMAWMLLRRGKINEAAFKKYASYDGWDAEGIEFLKATWTNVPTLGAAFELMMKGELTRDEWKSYVAMQSWPAGWDEKLYALFMRLPTPQQGFYMWIKGQITKAERNQLYKAGGHDEAWFEDLTENWYYTPTIYDLVRMADYIELDQVWALNVMRKRGVRDADRAKIWTMLELRPLREEIRAITEKWLWRYRFGRCTLTELQAALFDLGLKTKERYMLEVKAELDYEDELVDEMIEILQYRFRNSVISEEEFLAGLIALPVREEKANLIVELEKAKGYTGGY